MWFGLKIRLINFMNVRVNVGGVRGEQGRVCPLKLCWDLVWVSNRLSSPLSRWHPRVYFVRVRVLAECELTRVADQSEELECLLAVIPQ